MRVMVVATSSYAQNGWLVGTWELVPEDDSDARARIESDAEGRVFSINPSLGNKIPGSYALSETQIASTYDWKGQKLKLVYT